MANFTCPTCSSTLNPLVMNKAAFTNAVNFMSAQTMTATMRQRYSRRSIKVTKEYRMASKESIWLS